MAGGNLVYIYFGLLLYILLWVDGIDGSFFPSRWEI